MFETIKDLISGRENKEKLPPIHPDFLIEDPSGYWWWNYTNFGEYLHKKGVKMLNPFDSMKIAFPFDDPELLNNCPFQAKVGKNSNKNETKYFGVVYGYKGDEESLKSWASRFPRWELIVGLDNAGNAREFSKIEKSPKKENGDRD